MEEINKFLIYQMRNLCNTVSQQLYGKYYHDLYNDSKCVVNGFIRNLLLYNHFSNEYENWNNNPMEEED